jgi:hypothetical protein
MRKRIILALCAIAAMALLASACKSGEKQDGAAVTPLLSMSRYGESMGMESYSQQLYGFIMSTLSGPYGVHTNWLDTDQTAEAATGHEVLSESASLMLRHLALTGKRQEFATALEQADKTFDRQRIFSYRYSPKLQKQFTLNAAVDDLRIIRALYEAGQAFGEDSYTKLADKYGSRFYQYNVKNGALYDFYDEEYEETNAFITLCYIDLKTLQQLPASSGERDELVSRMLNIARNGYISDVFPFYETRYNYEMSSYSSDRINTVESLLTVLSLAEVRQHEEASVRFIKEKVASGALYGQYSRDGEAQNDVQSTAIYAIAAMIGSELNDKELYESAVQRMNAFRVTEADSPFHGAFANTAVMQAYSFDNLMALLAYSY